MNTRAHGLPRAFWAIFAIAVVGWAGRLVLPFLTLYMTIEQGFSLTHAGLLMSLFGLGGLVAVLVAGPLMDRFGPRLVMVIAVVGTGACAGVLAASPPQVFVSALLLGLGAFSYCMPPSANTMITALVPPNQWRKAFSYHYIAMNIGFAIGPVFGGILVDIAYSLLFVAEAGCMLMSLLLIIFFLPSSTRQPHGVSTDTGGISLASQPVRKVYKDTFFLLFIVLNIIFMALYMQTQLSLPLIMQDQGFSATQYGLLLTVNGVFIMLLQLPLDRLTAKTPYPKLLVAATLMLLVSYVVHIYAAELWVYYVAMCVWSLAEMLNIPIASTITSMFATKKTVGSYQSFHTTTGPLSSLLAPLLGGVLLEQVGASGFWIVCCAVLAVVLVVRQLSVKPMMRRFEQGA